MENLVEGVAYKVTMPVTFTATFKEYVRDGHTGERIAVFEQEARERGNTKQRRVVFADKILDASEVLQN